MRSTRREERQKATAKKINSEPFYRSTAKAFELLEQDVDEEQETEPRAVLDADKRKELNARYFPTWSDEQLAGL